MEKVSPLTISPLIALESAGSVAKAICVATTSFFRRGVVVVRELPLAESVKVSPSVVSETDRPVNEACPLFHVWDVVPARTALPDWTVRATLPVW